MFVKKFEAPSLEQALKMVKSELGPEALVLSTQEKKNGKLFSRKVVEVTAAADKKSKESRANGRKVDEIQSLLNSKKDSQHSAREQKSSDNNKFPETYVPKRKQEQLTPEKKLSQRYIDIDFEPTIGTTKPQVAFRSDSSRYEAGFKMLGISSERAGELSKKMANDFSKADLSDPQFLSKAKSKLLSQGIRTLSAGEFFKSRAWVALGAPGSGKTTLLVKLAILAREQDKSVSLISMDNRKFSGRSELAGYARLIRVPFFTEMGQAPQDKFKLIDSPSIHLSEETQLNLEKLCAERSPLLVLDACSRLSELLRQVDKAMVYSPEAIAFTKMDNVEDRGVIYDVLKATQLPLAGISVSSSFKTKFRFLTPQDLAQLLVKE